MYKSVKRLKRILDTTANCGDRLITRGRISGFRQFSTGFIYFFYYAFYVYVISVLVFSATHVCQCFNSECQRNIDTLIYLQVPFG